MTLIYNRRMFRPAVAALIRRCSLPAVAAGLVLGTSSCGPAIDLKQVLTIVDETGGWRDGGIVDSKNKIIPRVTFRLRKSTDADLRPLSLNVVFKRLNPAPPAGTASSAASEEEWDEVFVQNIAFDSNPSAPITVESRTGYTGDPPQSRADLLAHSQFRDMRVHIFAKHSSTQWVELGQFTIPRKLIAQ